MRRLSPSGPAWAALVNFSFTLLALGWTAVAVCRAQPAPIGSSPLPASDNDYRFDCTISRPVLERYLQRAITMEGLLNGRGDLDDNLRISRTSAQNSLAARCVSGVRRAIC